MPDVESRPPVIGRDVVGVHRKTSGAGRVAFGVAERIEAEKRQLGAGANVVVRDQLVLVEEPVRLILVNVPDWAERPHAARRVRRIEGSG